MNRKLVSMCILTVLLTFVYSVSLRFQPVKAGGTIYIGSNDHNFYAINPDRTEKWRFTLLDKISKACAIGADGTIYLVTGGDGNRACAIGIPEPRSWWSTPLFRYAAAVVVVIGIAYTLYFRRKRKKGTPAS